MSDIFVSYARSTAKQAQQVAEALRALGYSVWIDDDLPAHRTYSRVIEEQMAAAKAAVVIWSADAVQSEWVLSEANRAREDRKLIQVTTDKARLPMPFDTIQCADLAGWSGDTDAPGWRKVVASIDALAGAPRLAAVSDAGVPTPPESRLSVCVLPFANMSDDPQQEYFSDGITEDIITDLSKVSAMFVVARNTAFTFKGKNVDVPQVARQLSVSHVLEGSVRKAGNRVRITAQLIDGATGGHAWAERYDRDLDDIFALQDEISRQVVAALKLKLLPKEARAIAKRGTTNAEAYDLYLMARKEYTSGLQGDPQWGETITRLARRATQIDPNYAAAWAYLSLGQIAKRYMHSGGGEDGLAAAERAVALDPALAEAHAVKGRVFFDANRHAEAEREIVEALRLDPASGLANYTAGMLFHRQNRIDEALRCFKVAALDETDFNAAMFLMDCHMRQHDREGTLRAAALVVSHAETVLAQDRNNGYAMASAANALVLLGEEARAREMIERALLLNPDDFVVRYQVARVQAARFGELDAAVETLAPAVARMAPNFLEFLFQTSELGEAMRDPRIAARIKEAEARWGPIARE